MIRLTAKAEKDAQDAALRVLANNRLDWRYTSEQAKAKHGLWTASHHTALCGTRVPYSAYWRGTGSQAEYERAASLPECKRCLAVFGYLTSGTPVVKAAVR